MKKKTLWMIGIIAMLASCSQNETVLEADNRSVTVITAAVDNGMKTRAATVSDDDAVTRCLVQVLKDGNSVGAPIAGVEGDAGYTFTVPDWTTVRHTHFCFGLMEEKPIIQRQT